MDLIRIIAAAVFLCSCASGGMPSPSLESADARSEVQSDVSTKCIILLPNMHQTPLCYTCAECPSNPINGKCNYATILGFSQDCGVVCAPPGGKLCQ